MTDFGSVQEGPLGQRGVDKQGLALFPPARGEIGADDGHGQRRRGLDPRNVQGGESVGAGCGEDPSLQHCQTFEVAGRRPQIDTFDPRLPGTGVHQCQEAHAVRRKLGDSQKGVAAQGHQILDHAVIRMGTPFHFHVEGVRDVHFGQAGHATYPGAVSSHHQRAVPFVQCRLARDPGLV